MCICQNEQVIKLRNVLVSPGKKRMATEFTRSQTTGLSCVGRDAGMLSEIHAKTAQYCRAEDDCLAIDMDMICHRSSLINDKAISSFRKRL